MSIFGTLPDIEKLSPLVTRVMGGNPGQFTLQGTNTYLIGTGLKRIIIDTGDGKQVWISKLKKVLSEENAQIDTVLITHWHRDHVGGVENLLAHYPEAKVYKNDPSKDMLPIENGQVFRVEGATLTAYHTPGHTADHMSFFLEEEGAIFTGDNVLGHGTTVFEDLATYLTSLKKMLATPGMTGRAYPGHGAVLGDAKVAINSYISHRQVRERQILAVLKKGNPSGYDDTMTPMEIVERLYKDAPKELLPAAEWNVLQVLKKLEGEKKVTKDADGWMVRGRSSY